MSHGIVLFGINNTAVNYVQLAVMAAAFIKNNMPNTNVCLITDKQSKEYYEQTSKWKLDDFFSHVLLVPEKQQQFQNTRSYKDTRYYSTPSQFKNESRASVYDLSPFDETLLLDSDYLICNNVLSNVWGSSEEVLINRHAVGLMHNKLHSDEFRLNPFGIRMYWATAIYFRKGDKAEQLFKLVDHIKENWEYYKLTYDFPGNLFRNDYAFSIAIHILNGFIDSTDFFPPLPDDTILTALDTDQFFNISAKDDLSFFANDIKDTWKFYATRTKGLNVHCMNKLSLMNHMDKIMETLCE